MPEQLGFKLRGPFRFRVRIIFIFSWSVLYVTLRRILRGPLLPSWSLQFEASSHFQKSLYKAVYRYRDINDGRMLLEAFDVTSPSLEMARIEPVSSPIRGSWFRPQIQEVERVILYLHGAYAFYAGAERGLVADLAAATKLPVFALEYRLTPEHPFPAQLDDAFESYNWLLELGYQGPDIILMGSSAGGNLCLSLVQKLREQGSPLLMKVVALCPWTDIGNSGESIRVNERYDILDKSMLEKGARWLVGENNPLDPLISPLYADMSGLPTMYIQAGGKEIFIDMIQAFYKRAYAQGADIALEVWESMNHMFQAYGDQLPEAREAMERIVQEIHEE